MFAASGLVQNLIKSHSSCSLCRPPVIPSRIPSDCLVLLSLFHCFFFWKPLYQGVSLLSAHGGYYLHKQLNSAVYSENKPAVLCQALFPQKSNLTIEQQTEKLGVTEGEKVPFQRYTMVSYQVCLLDSFHEGNHQLLKKMCVSSLALGAVVSR